MQAKKINIKEILSFVKKDILVGGHLQSLGAVGIIISIYFVFDLRIHWILLISVYLITYNIYLYNHLKEARFDKLDDPEKHLHIDRFVRIRYWFVFIVPAIILILCISLNEICLSFLLLLLFLLGIFYTLYIKSLTSIVPFTKNIYVALAFSLSGFLILSTNNIRNNFLQLNDIFAYLITIFIFIFIMQLFLDFKDISGDKIRNLKTLPLIAPKRKYVILIIFNIVFFVSMICFFYFQIIPLTLIFTILIVPLNIFAYWLYNKYAVRRVFTYYPSIVLLWSVLAMLGKIIIN